MEFLGFFKEKGDVHFALVPLAVDAERGALALDLLVPDDQDKRDLLDLRLADLLADLLPAEVDRRSQAVRLEHPVEGPGVVLVALGDRQDDGLDGSEPEGKASVVVLDEDAEEPLQGAEQGRWTM